MMLIVRTRFFFSGSDQLAFSSSKAACSSFTVWLLSAGR